MTVAGYDATHANVGAIPSTAQVVMGYVTGTPDIRWTTADWSKFPKARQVYIDQGGPGSPVHWADVRDVETGAWTPEAAVIVDKNWTAERPTIYCNQSTLPRILDLGWKRDIWLAKLQDGMPTTPPTVPGCKVPAQQYRFDGKFDVSSVFDDTWPPSGGGVKGVKYATPQNIIQLGTVYLTWDAVPAVDGKNPTGYTVVFYGLNGKEYKRTVVSDTTCVVGGLRVGWTYNVHIWANGGSVAPDHATIQVNVL